MRLSQDGLTEISNYGMSDYFRDNLATILNTWQANYSKPSIVDSVGNITDQAGVVHYFMDLRASNEEIVKGMILVVAGVIFNVRVEAVTNNYTRVYFDSNPGTISLGTEVSFLMYEKDRVLGAWDVHQENYVLNIGKKLLSNY